MVVRALWMGVGACILGAVSPCTCYAAWLIGAPLAYYGLYLALKFRPAPGTGTTTGLALGNLALVSNLVAAALGTMFLLMFLLYVVYFVFVLGAVGLAGMGNNF